MLAATACRARERDDADALGDPRELPLLEARGRPAIAEPTQFTESYGTQYFQRAATSPMSTLPVVDDATAEEAARAWLATHFGSLRESESLVLDEVTDREGEAAADGVPDRSIRVVFKQMHDGIKTPSSSSIGAASAAQACSSRPSFRSTARRVA